MEPGLACGSDTAHMSLFGYDPRHLYRGRGAYESMGAGLSMQPGDIAFKCNFATLDTATGIVLHRRADRRFEEEGPTLCSALNGLSVPGYPQHTISVKYATEHRCGVVVRGPGLTDAVSGTDPLKDLLPLLKSTPLDASSEAQHTAAVINAVNTLIQSVLETHPVNVQRRKENKNPANVVLLRGCGCRLALTPFQQLHEMRPCIVSPTKIIAGLGMCAEMEVINVPGTTGDYRTEFHKKAEAVAAALTQGPYEFAFLHVKAVDDAGHDRAVDLKVAYLEVVDRMVGQLLRLLWESEKKKKVVVAPDSSSLDNHNSSRFVEQQQQYCIVVTGDHSTPVEFGDHSCEPVPFAIASVQHVVHALGGDEAVQEIPLGPIPHPKAEHQQHNGGGGGGGDGGGATRAASINTTNGRRKHDDRIMNGDSVSCFTEFDAAEGSLGRFPGSQVMGVVKDFRRTSALNM